MLLLSGFLYLCPEGDILGNACTRICHSGGVMLTIHNLGYVRHGLQGDLNMITWLTSNKKTFKL